MEKKKKKLLFIILLSVLAVGVITTVVIVLVKKNSTQEVESNTNTTTTTNPPTYETADSDTALSLIVAAAKEWSSDAQFLSCGGVVIQYERKPQALYYGGEDGQEPSWSCFVYSRSLKQDITVKWYKGTVTVEDEDPYIWGQSQYEADPNDRDFFDPNDFVNTKEVYNLLISSGLNTNTSYVTYVFGFADALDEYGNDVVWQVNEYSRETLENPEDEYSQGLRTKIHYVNGTSGELIMSENL